VLVLTGRPQDAWLASWSNADAAVSRPLDPIDLQGAVARLPARQGVTRLATRRPDTTCLWSSTPDAP